MNIPEGIVAKILSLSDMTAKKSALTVDKNFNTATDYDSVWETVTFDNPNDISVFEKYGKYMKNVTMGIDVNVLMDILKRGYLSEVLFLDVVITSGTIPILFGDRLNKLKKVKKLYVSLGNVTEDTNIRIKLPQLEEVSFVEDDFNSPMVNVVFTEPVYKHLVKIETIVDSTNVPYAPNAKYLNLETCYNGYVGYNFKDMEIKYLSVGIDYSFSQYSELYTALSMAKSIDKMHIILYGEDISLFRKFDNCKTLEFLFSSSSRNVTIDYSVIEDVRLEFDTEGYDEAFVSLLNVPIGKLDDIKNIKKSNEIIMSLINLS